ncbi:sigma 54-interacting transcriptional regulator [Stigmatella sp. ncwal1]|uniref:Sigma 54-interacting transcriptional regulator n=1 Tax=Stigmatella ashevillensis TaxID=2995309 RepID=A0ABT5DDK6_9BACT|nr:sigma 54-interacting transcriptional regulator [Stigmatella ashevillena]MDC0711742.1 sigma 54-interacting transcriptional regulator [Stigmatella ashevillena]
MYAWLTLWRVPTAPHDVTPDGERDRLQQERDFYRSLLELGARDSLEPFLEEALALSASMSGAKRGYIELLEDQHHEGPPRFWMAHGCYDEEVEEIRATFSRGVIAEALATGQTIVTESALRDPRFGSRNSVRRNRSEAVLCAPIGASPTLGVVYLQDRHQPGPFSEEDRKRLEIFARYLATFAERLLTLHRQREAADATQPFRGRLRAEGVIGRSASLARVLEQVSLVAPLDVNVLLTGPSGTGKTQLARVIHDNSPRASHPFLELNCAALPETLVESELFGVLPGAHSTASRKVEGKVAAAEGGTLFLDEVGDLPLTSQAKLLQLLQSREYFPLGGTRPQRADVRILAATNVDLRAAVARRTFREDLLYRLEVLPVRLPSLAERPEDLLELAEYFCASACEQHHLPRLRLSPGALRAVEAAEWPGNVRELAHKVQAAVIRASGEGVARIERRHLFPEAKAEGTRGPEPLTFQEATRRFQEQLLLKTLEDTAWNITEAAGKLELSRSHIYNLIAAFGLERRKP